MLKNSLVLLASMGASSTFAAESADLTVVGMIAPQACVPVFVGGGKVDYGIIPASTLSATTETKLERRVVTYTIACDQPMIISTTWSDIQNNSVLINSLSSATASYGLGKQGASNIGRYTITQGSVIADDQPVKSIFQASGAWARGHELEGEANVKNDGTKYSYSLSDSATPGAFRHYSGSVIVEPTIVPSKELDLTHPVHLDGISIMTINYL